MVIKVRFWPTYVWGMGGWVEGVREELMHIYATKIIKRNPKTRISPLRKWTCMYHHKEREKKTESEIHLTTPTLLLSDPRHESLTDSSNSH